MPYTHAANRTAALRREYVTAHRAKVARLPRLFAWFHRIDCFYCH